MLERGGWELLSSGTTVRILRFIKALLFTNRHPAAQRSTHRMSDFPPCKEHVVFAVISWHAEEL
jgi:hypothetical protein